MIDRVSGPRGRIQRNWSCANGVSELKLGTRSAQNIQPEDSSYGDEVVCSTARDLARVLKNGVFWREDSCAGIFFNVGINVHRVNVGILVCAERSCCSKGSK